MPGLTVAGHLVHGQVKEAPIQYTYSHREGGEVEKVRGATVHKTSRKDQHD